MQCLGYLKPGDTLSKRPCTSHLPETTQTSSSPRDEHTFTVYTEWRKLAREELILRFAAQTRTGPESGAAMHIANPSIHYSRWLPLLTSLFEELRLSLATMWLLFTPSW